MGRDVSRARLSLIAATFIFGTIGILRRYLPVPSGFLAMTRGLLGATFLLLLLGARRQRPNLGAIRSNLRPLALSGVMIGVNWILLFESYRYTTVAVATLGYYMAPVFILLSAPLLLRERLTPRKLVCVIAALFGMALVSGVTGISEAPDWRGVLLGLGAALLYAGVVLVNKGVHGVSGLERTVVQVGTAGVVLIPYVALTEDLSSVSLTPLTLALLLTAGLVNTGLAYALYFGSIDALPAHTLALLSYLDPVVALLLSAVVLREPMTLSTAAGAVMILCAAVAAELPEPSQPKQKQNI